MPPLINLTDKRFGRLLVTKLYGHINNRTQWECICDCGKTHIVESYRLQTGVTRSCGCLRKESTTEMKTTHGLTNHPLYQVFSKIKDRCYLPNNPAYKNYGGRGITICDEWLNDRASFIKWALNNGYEKGLEIDRIENDLGYSPDNCRFVNRLINANNKRNNFKILFKGELVGLPYLEKISNGVKARNIYLRIKYSGWSVHKAISIPIKKTKEEMRQSNFS